MTWRWRFLAGLALFAAAFFVWDRRAAWVVVAKEPGFIPGGCGQDTSIPWIHAPGKDSVLFADTGERIPLPPGLDVGQIRNFTPDRRLLVFHDAAVQDYVVLDLEAGRVVSFPGVGRERVFPTTDGTLLRIEADPEAKGPRRYETRTRDGRVVHARELPPLEAPWKFGYLTWDGAYVLETCDEGKPPVRIHAMATGEQWTFEERIAELSPSGRIWLYRGKVLRAYDLPSRKELWSTSFMEDVGEVRLLGPGQLLVREGNGALTVLGAERGERRLSLEGGERSAGTLYWHQRRTAGPRSFLVAGDLVWDLDTGRRLAWTVADAAMNLEFFQDGRRAVVSGRDDVPAVVDVDTGRPLFRFVLDTPVDEGEGRGRALIAGRRVLTTAATARGWEVFLWERRHPEGPWGHLYRPEVWAAVVLGLLLLIGLLTPARR